MNYCFYILAETSWMQGGSRPQMPQGAGGTGVSGQTLHSQISPGKYYYTLKLNYL